MRRFTQIREKKQQIPPDLFLQKISMRDQERATFSKSTHSQIFFTMLSVLEKPPLCECCSGLYCSIVQQKFNNFIKKYCKILKSIKRESGETA